MSSTPTPAITLSDLSFVWPDGSPALDRLTATIGTGHTGLVGDNGTGKSTLLRLVAGELRPTSGRVVAHGSVALLPQHLTLHTEASVAGLLGVRTTLAALRAVEDGSTSPIHFDRIGADWDLEARTTALLAELGLPDIDLDRTVSTLSGGEAMLVGLAGLRLTRSRIALLDEPTNNLDRRSRDRLYEVVRSWPDTLVVVSHDVALLELMECTAELRAGHLTLHGGPYSSHRAQVEQEQRAAAQALRAAEQVLRTEERQRIEAQTKLARRQRYAQSDHDNRRKPKMIMNNRKSEAQVSAGKVRNEVDDKVEAARDRVAERAAELRHDLRIRVDLPDPEVPAGRRICDFVNPAGDVIPIVGPRRVALTGPNGIGKTRLLQGLCSPSTPSGAVRIVAHTDRIAMLPQRLDHLDDEQSLLDAVRRAAPRADPHAVRAKLARFGFRAAVPHRRIGELSGGERFRVALAQLLLAEPPAQLLVLDEPTNNVDLTSMDQLVDALAGYRGALVVVSHDDAFLSRLGIDRHLVLDTTGVRLERT